MPFGSSKGGVSNSNNGFPFRMSSTNDDSMSMDDVCPKMSRTQRLYGFVGCFVVGGILSFLGWITLFGAARDHSKISMFAVFYGLGQIVAVSATCFLSGPKRQFKRMFDKTRRIATSVYLGLVVIVMAVALAKPNLWALVMFLMFLQCCAAVWYAASYIPYGRRILKEFVVKVCTCGKGSAS